MIRNRWWLLLTGLIVAIFAVGAVAFASDRGSVDPLPFGSDPAEWTNADGTLNEALVPGRAPVSTFDGGLLMHADGSPVTVPQGERYRGEISEEEAERQFAEVERMQREDACRRGVEVPLSASVSGAQTMEEQIELANKKLEQAIKANGGRKTVSACD